MKKTSFCFPVLALLLAACSGGVSEDGLKNGKYSATGLNFNGTADVSVSVKKGRIASIDVRDDGHTYAQYQSPLKIVPERIIEAQNTGVDGVTGATFTADAVKMAVDDALAQARGERPVERKNAALSFTPGTYTGTGKGYGGSLQARVTFTENAVSDIQVTSQRETAHVGDVSFPIMTKRILAANGLAVDAVSGATFSSHALKAAVLDAAVQAGVSSRQAFIRNNVAPEEVFETIEDTWDVVIIGGGGAGLCAAAQAAQDGNTVLIIEKNAELGGNTLISGGTYQATDHSLVWEMDRPEATTAIGFDGRQHNKVRSTVGCVNDLKTILGWNEEPFDEQYYKTHEFVAGDIKEQSKHGVHQEFLPTLRQLKKEISAYLAYAEPKLAKGTPENQLIQFSTTSLHIFQTYYGGLRQSVDRNEWIHGDFELIRQFVEEGELLKPWLMEMGVGFTDAQSTLIGALWYRGNSMTGCTADADGDGRAERYQGNWGSYFMAPLAVVTGASEKNRVMRSTTAGELIVENGRVTGVKAKVENGADVIAHARKGVIIATGGYAANIQKVLKTNRYWSRQYLSPTIGTTNRSSLRGDGIDMATAIGAATVGEGWTQLMPLGNVADGSISYGGVENAVFISPQDGKRYVDECSERDVLSLNGFKHGIEWNGARGVFLYFTPGFGGFGGGFGGFGGFGGGVAKNTPKSASCKGSELENLFQELGIEADAAAIRQTIREYDMAVMEGRQPAGVGKSHATGLIGSARRGADGKYDPSTYTIDDANLSMRIMAPSTHHTMGGLKVDLDRHVLDESGNAIPGLYAAGEVTGGFFGGNRLGGNALTEVMASGRIAARAVNADNR